MSDLTPKNPKDAAASNRARVQNFPTTALLMGALGLTEGEFKYEPYNWRDAPVHASVYYDAIMRHLGKWFNGEDHDRVTLVPHLANVLASVAILVDAGAYGTLVDDRRRHDSEVVPAVAAYVESVTAHLRALFPPRSPSA